MAFITVNKEEVAQFKEGGGGFISESGIYPLTIKDAVVRTTKNGATELIFNFKDTNDNDLTIYGLVISKVDGTPTFGMDILKSLAVIADLDSIADPVERPVKLGGQDKEEDMLVLEDLDGVEVLVRLQNEYSKYQGKVNRKFIIKKFYRVEDHKTATEIAADKEATQYETDLKYADKDRLKDVTEEEVEAFKQGKKTASKETTKKPAVNPFVKK
jgi:hypothetical protein